MSNHKISVDKSFKAAIVQDLKVNDADVHVMDVKFTTLGTKASGTFGGPSGYIPFRVVKANGSNIQAYLPYYIKL